MFAYIKGQVIAVEPSYAIIEASGLAYEALMANPYRLSDKIGEKAQIWLCLHVSQDAVRLYGFLSQAEKQLFLKLCQVSGIGPKSALSILSLGDEQGLMNAIEVGDVKFLTQFPGVGKKTAQQMILDLKGKLVELMEEEQPSPITTSSQLGAKNKMLDELTQALETLGYKERQIKQIINATDFSQVEDTAQAIRLALKTLTYH